MLQDVQGSGQVPEGRENEGHPVSDAPELLEKGVRILDMLHRVRAEDGLKGAVLERKTVDRADLDETRHVRVTDDVGVETPAVRPAAANVEIPFPPAENARLEDAIAQDVERLGDGGQAGCA